MKCYGGHFFNYRATGGYKGGVDLKPGTRWTVFSAEEHKHDSPPQNNSNVAASEEPPSPGHIPFPNVMNLDEVFPANFTPDQLRPPQARLSAVRRRGLFPVVELEESPLAQPAEPEISERRYQQGSPHILSWLQRGGRYEFVIFYPQTAGLQILIEQAVLSVGQGEEGAEGEKEELHHAIALVVVVISIMT